MEGGVFQKIISWDDLVRRASVSVESLLGKGQASESRWSSGHRIHGRDMLQLSSLQPFATVVAGCSSNWM